MSNDRLMRMAAAGVGGGGSGGWDLANAALISIPSASFTTNAKCFFISPDGENMYIYYTGYIYQYTLTTPWDISTYIYSNKRGYVYTEEASAEGLFFKPDGLSMYVVGVGTDTVYQYTLTTAWDVSTASYADKSSSVAAQEGSPTGLFFKSDGLSMYVVGTAGDTVYQYTLTTEWDVSTASYANKSFSVAAQDPNPRGLFFKPDGLTMYIAGSLGGQSYQYTLTTAWDLDTANFPRAYFAYVGSEEAVPQDLAFSPDGLSMYVIGSSGDEVNQFTLSPAWDVSTATFARLFSVKTQDPTPNALFFKPDGLSMYMTGSSTDTVYQYTLTEPWNLATASYSNKSFGVAAQETIPQGLFFKPDGLTMYVVGNATDTVYQYTLTDPWNLDTAYYSNTSFSVAAQEGGPTGIFFKPDGLSMYIVGYSGDDVNQYTLTTPWDLNTASYMQNFGLVVQSTNPTGLCFNTDGTLMFTVDSITRTVWTYSL